MIDLSASWGYLENIVAERLAHNQTDYQYSQGKSSEERERYKQSIEMLGAAGELAARLFLHLPCNLHTYFDGGEDIHFRGWRIDVKATHWTRKLERRYLQWPTGKYIKADIILMTAVNLLEYRAEVLGYAWNNEVANALLNQNRDNPCYEIPIPELRNAWNLFSLNEKHAIITYPGRHSKTWVQ